MSAEDQRTANSAVVLNKVATAAFPAVGLAPWMSDYPKNIEAQIVMLKTIADGTEELDRQVWMLEHAEDKPANGETKIDEEEIEIFDTSKLTGGAYFYGYVINRLASNMHNFAPSIEGKRTRQAIALAKANNPGLATIAGDEPKKRTLWQKMTFQNRGKQEQ